MFEKNADLLGGFGDVTGDPDVDDWSLETLRLVQNPEQPGGFDPASIPVLHERRLRSCPEVETHFG
jgi:hypothetical protein